MWNIINTHFTFVKEFSPTVKRNWKRWIPRLFSLLFRFFFISFFFLFFSFGVAQEKEKTGFRCGPERRRQNVFGDQKQTSRKSIISFGGGCNKVRGDQITASTCQIGGSVCRYSIHKEEKNYLRVQDLLSIALV